MKRTITIILLIASAGFAQEISANALAVSDAEAKVAEELFQDGRKLFFQSDFLEAIKKLAKAAEANPSKISYKLLLAKAHRAVKQDAEATKVFEDIVKTNPEHVEAAIELADLLTAQKEPDRVIAILEPMLKLKHNYPLYHLLAEASYQKEDLNKARKYYEEALKLNRRNRDDHYQLGNIYLAQKRFAKAGASYEQAGGLGYTSGVFHFKLGSVYFNLHNYLGKVTTAQVASGTSGEISNELYLIDPVPGKKDTFYVTGPRAAVYQIAKARKMGIDIFDIRFLEANVWLAAHHYAKADTIYKEIEEKVAKVDAGMFWSQWSQTALGLDDYDNFIARLQKATDAEPVVYKATMSDALITVARRYQQRGVNAKYIEYLNKAVALNPLSARLHMTLGDAYWTTGKRKEAIQQYKFVLELEPQFSQRVRLLNRIRGQEDTAPLTTTAANILPAVQQQVALTGIRCLLSGKPAVAEFTVSYKGAMLYFCCSGCKSDFAGNLAKHSALANHQLMLTGQAEAVTCALTGRKLNPKFNATVAGVNVPLCCQGCENKVIKANHDQKIEMIFSNVAFSKHFRILRISR
jgi:tetratricopeptide (TPR) repeat protein